MFKVSIEVILYSVKLKRKRKQAFACSRNFLGLKKHILLNGKRAFFCKLFFKNSFWEFESWKSITKWYVHLSDSKIVPLNAPVQWPPRISKVTLDYFEHTTKKTPKQTPKHHTTLFFSINKNVPHLQHSTPIPSCFPRITSSTIGWCFHQLFQYHPPPKRSRPEEPQQLLTHVAGAVGGTILPLQPPVMPRVGRPAEMEPKFVYVVEAAEVAVHHGKEPKVPETSLGAMNSEWNHLQIIHMSLTTIPTRMEPCKFVQKKNGSGKLPNWLQAILGFYLRWIAQHTACIWKIWYMGDHLKMRSNGMQENLFLTENSLSLGDFGDDDSRF